MIELLILLAVFGFLVWLLVNYVPMVEPVKRAIIVIAVVVMVLYVLRVLGVGDVPVPRLR